MLRLEKNFGRGNSHCFFGLICGLFDISIAGVAPETKETKCGLKIEIPIKTT